MVIYTSSLALHQYTRYIDPELSAGSKTASNGANFSCMIAYQQHSLVTTPLKIDSVQEIGLPVESLTLRPTNG